ncbi:hypothetical protein TWF102_004112 [Orbilia oligospora]|uniref:Uncharacterized protein n=1 Tax=Orbilia oligospora TaxID=2813651 RepID=A0A7C8K6X1_ORBOL|nr:hypothetical protein TWF102_004112 [Orbilia oligospora]KAF3117641.1 hypothetical protein TWF103_004324 [Orbilia oligospora]KAF3142842.1 hypothetical protein TWF703_000346 [Orbilia oligospora]
MLFFSKFLVCAIALAAPSLAALNADQTAVYTRLSQMTTKDTNSGAIVDGMTAASIMSNGNQIVSFMQVSVSDLEFVRSKAISGGPVAAGMVMDANIISTSFTFWAQGHTVLMLKMKDIGIIVRNSLNPWKAPILAVMQMELTSIIAVTAQLNAMLPGTGYAAQRNGISTQANTACKALKEAIVASGGSAPGGANTCV